MIEPRFNDDGSRYRPYWWYLAWTLVIAGVIVGLVAGVYWLAVTAPAVLGWIGYALMILIVLAMFAFVAWIGQGSRD